MSKAQAAISDAFSKVAKRHREKRGLSRAALTQEAGLHPAYIGLLAREKTESKFGPGKAHCECFGLPLAKMISAADRF